MGFYFALAQLDGSIDTGTATEISPRPTRVDYPTQAAGQLLTTTAGTVIQQQPLRDSRVRTWEWAGYPGWFQRYQDLWAQLEPLRSRYRAGLGLSPFVYLKEDETQELCLVTPTAGSPPTVIRTFPYWKVRVTSVGRELRKDGGLVKYDTTTLQFVIDDPTWSYLG